MERNYLSTGYHIFFISLCFVSLFISIKIFLFLLTSYLTLLYLFRRKKYELIEDTRYEKCSTFLAPITGYIKKIERLDSHIRLYIQSNLLDDKGLYMPLEGEIERSCDDEIFILRKKMKVMKLNIKKGFMIPSYLWVDNGDFGKTSTNIGYMGIMSLVELDVPNKTEIFINVSDKVYGARTILGKTENNYE